MKVHLEVVLSRKTVVFTYSIKNNYFGSCIRQDLLLTTKSVTKRENKKRNQQIV